MIYEDMLVPKIDSFTGENRFLSNFSPSEFYWRERNWRTVEHAYQASKTLNQKEFEEIAVAPTPGAAKLLGRKVTLREDWNEVKIQYMREFLILKFSDAALMKKLLKTSGYILIEGNTWNDTFWGVCNGKGKNILGKLLMSIRDEEEMIRLSVTGKHA